MKTAAKVDAIRAQWRQVENDVEWCGAPEILEHGVIIGLLLGQFADMVDALELDEPIEAIGA
jgi:hypothetical protein